ncbi:MAG: DUF4388 domain-containing protein [Myxococcaceae bacterium]
MASSETSDVRVVVKVAGESVTLAIPRGADLKAGEMRAVSHGAEALLLFKEGVGEEGYFAGSLRSMTIGEVFAQVLSGIRTGKLIVSAKGARKVVSFKDAQILFASSTEPHERFGRKLQRLRLVTQAQLDEALTLVKPGSKLGQVLKRKGWVSANALYSAMTDLVRDIVLNLFELSDGDFLFFDGATGAEDAVKLPGKVRDLVLEGVKRTEQVQLWKTKFPDSLRLAAKGRPASPEEELLFAALAKASTVGETRTHFDGGEYAFLSALNSTLNAKSVVEVTAAAPTKKPAAVGTPLPPPPGSSPLDRYGTLIRSICKALTQAGQPLADLRSFLEDPLPGMEIAFKGVTLGDDGKMDLPKVMQNATKADPKLGRVQAYEALESFVSYALFSAKNALPQDLADSLNRDFRKLQEGTT